MIIDAHVHLFPNEAVAHTVLDDFQRRWGVGYISLGTPELHRSEMQRAGVDAAVMLSFAPDNQLKNNNFWTTAITRPGKNRPAAFPNLIPFVSISPNMKGRPLLDELEHKRTWGMRGLKIHPIAQGFAPDDPRMFPVYTWLVQQDLPITSHCGINISAGSDTHLAHPDRWRSILQAFPALRLTLAHMGGGFWEETLRLCAEFPQVMLDTAVAICGNPGVIKDRNWLDDAQALEMIRTVGAARVMFGSDYPWFDPAEDLARLRSLPLQAAELRQILGENAARWLKM